MDDVREQLARNLTISLRNGARQLNDVRGIDERLVGAAKPLLEPFGVGLRDAESVHDVARDIVAAEGNRAEVADLSFVKEREVGGARTHLDESHAQFLLVFGENGERTRQRLEHELAHTISRALDRFAEIERR